MSTQTTRPRDLNGRLAVYGGWYYRIIRVMDQEKGGCLLQLSTVAEDPEAPVITQLVDGADVRLVGDDYKPEHTPISPYRV